MIHLESVFLYQLTDDDQYDPKKADPELEYFLPDDNELPRFTKIEDVDRRGQIFKVKSNGQWSTGYYSGYHAVVVARKRHD